MEVAPREWLRRYIARWRERKPHMADQALTEWTQDAHEALSGEYPDRPEQAVDDELDGCPEISI